MDPNDPTGSAVVELPVKLKARKVKKKSPKRKPKSKAKRPAKKRARKAKAGAVVRTERLDMRLSKAEKAKVLAKAKKSKRTVTSIVYEAIAKLKV